MYDYKVVREVLKEEDVGEYKTYGIQIGDYIIHDISLNEKEICELIDRMNLYQLSPIHLNEVVEDFLEENY